MVQISSNVSSAFLAKAADSSTFLRFNFNLQSHVARIKKCVETKTTQHVHTTNRREKTRTEIDRETNARVNKTWWQ